MRLFGFLLPSFGVKGYWSLAFSPAGAWEKTKAQFRLCLDQSLAQPLWPFIPFFLDLYPFLFVSILSDSPFLCWSLLSLNLCLCMSPCISISAFLLTLSFYHSFSLLSVYLCFANFSFYISLLLQIFSLMFGIFFWDSPESCAFIRFYYYFLNHYSMNWVLGLAMKSDQHCLHPGQCSRIFTLPQHRKNKKIKKNFIGSR